MTLTPEERANLCNAAQEAAKSAYAKYSNFRVGAAVLAGDQIYIGVNVENASYGLTICAERVALCSAIAQGERAFRAIAVACIDADPNLGLRSLVPCGNCRQVIAELAETAEIIICGSDKSFALSDLLPLHFKLD
ncbi:MAG: cytidine deaminase [Leptolyngbyaceae cyanobacterium RU_5_1]|nr:cytidine deaminase [Leptolyngbyaceae cyanobacterium RU_5_1]